MCLWPSGLRFRPPAREIQIHRARNSLKAIQNYPQNHRVLQGAPSRGQQLYFTFPSAPDPLVEASKARFLTPRVATLSGAPRQAPLDKMAYGQAPWKNSKITRNSSKQVFLALFHCFQGVWGWAILVNLEYPKFWSNTFLREYMRACVRTRANTGKHFWETFFRVFCQILGGILSARACIRTRANTGKHLCIGFVPGGNFQGVSARDLDLSRWRPESQA